MSSTIIPTVGRESRVLEAPRPGLRIRESHVGVGLVHAEAAVVRRVNCHGQLTPLDLQMTEISTDLNTFKSILNYFLK